MTRDKKPESGASEMENHDQARREPRRESDDQARREPRRETMLRVDGRGQVLDMLRAADPEFREILLRGIEKRDAQLARELRREL